MGRIRYEEPEPLLPLSEPGTTGGPWLDTPQYLHLETDMKNNDYTGECVVDVTHMVGGTTRAYDFAWENSGGDIQQQNRLVDAILIAFMIPSKLLPIMLPSAQ